MGNWLPLAPSLLLGLLLASAPAYAVQIEEVSSPAGVKAWLVEDHKLPLISLQFAFRGGSEQDPMDRQGLSTLTMNLLTEGAGDQDAAAFQEDLANHSITMEFEAGRDALFGSVKTLASDKEKAFGLLEEAVTKPRFDKDAFERLRGRQTTGMRTQLGDPNWQARYALFHHVYGDHPYGERHLGTTDTLQHITPDDVRQFATQHMARSNLVVAAAGDITPGELADVLDKIFGSLPATAQLAPVTDFDFEKSVKAETILVPRVGTQTIMLFAMPGPKRDNPEWYATEVANYILGGGGFSSRLMQEVRDKNGLTYGINTGVSSMEHSAIIVGEAATDNDKTAKAWSITEDTMRDFYAKGPTDAEITAAKDYLTGSMPLALTSTDKIAGALVQFQIEHLGRDYLDNYSDLIRKVTPGDITQAIKHWFNPDDASVVMVGKPDGIKPQDTQEQVHQ